MKTTVRKFALLIPILTTVLFFQVDGWSQDKKSFSWSDSSSANDNIVMTWNKNTPESEMKDDIKALAEKGITIKYSGVKRNSKDEITAIKVEYSDRKGNKGKMELENQSPINTIKFFKIDDQIGFGEPNNSSNGFGISPFNGFAGGDSFMKQFNLDNIPGMQSFNFSFPDGEGMGKSKSKIMIQKDGRKPLVIEDGEVTEGADEYSQEEIDEIKKNYKVESTDGNSRSYNFNFNSDSDDDIKKQFERMRQEMNKMNGSSEKDNDVKEIEKTTEEMIKAKEEMIKAKEEMEKAKKELDKAKSAMKTQKI